MVIGPAPVAGREVSAVSFPPLDSQWGRLVEQITTWSGDKGHYAGGGTCGGLTFPLVVTMTEASPSSMRRCGLKDCISMASFQSSLVWLMVAWGRGRKGRGCSISVCMCVSAYHRTGVQP